MRMRVFLYVLFAVICLLPPSFIKGQQPKTSPDAASATATVREMTLREFRSVFLNQRILILKGQDIGGSLGGWQPMKMTKSGSFTDDYNKGAFINLKYRDETPKVLSIRENTVAGTEKPTEGTTNAFGETITDADIVNPSVEVIVQFDDGQLAKFTSIVSLIMDRSAKWPDKETNHLDMEFMPVSTRDAHAKVVNQNLQGAIGQKVYAVHSTLLLKADISPADLTDFSRRLEKQVDDVQLLTPMTIVAAKYIDRYDLIIWKLQLDSGRFVIGASRYRDEDVSANRNDNSFLGRSIGTLLLNIPPNLTEREISAIRDRKIFRGMSRQAVIYSWGSASENDYGKGGKQLVYGDNQFVYLDNTGKVTDWQTIDK